MKREKDIVEFFDKYSEQLLPQDREQFIQSLKEKMEHLPVPSSFNKMDPEMSKEYAEWLLDRMKKEYRRQKREAAISCAFVCLIVAILLLLLYGMGAFAVSTTVTSVVFALVALTAVGLISGLIPSILKH